MADKKKGNEVHVRNVIIHGTFYEVHAGEVKQDANKVHEAYVKKLVMEKMAVRIVTNIRITIGVDAYDLVGIEVQKPIQEKNRIEGRN